MLIGHLDYLELMPFLPMKLHNAINYVKQHISADTPIGLYPVETDKIVVIVAENETKPITSHHSEYHEKFIDIHIVLVGEESFVFSSQLTGDISSDYNASLDLAFLTQPADEEKILTLTAGEFILFYPPQRHKPLCTQSQPSKIKKAIIKIDKNCI